MILNTLFLTDLPALSSAPSVEIIGTNQLEVTFPASEASSGTLQIHNYTLQYMSADMDWETYSTIQSEEGQESYNIMVTDLEVVLPHE